MVNIKIKLLEGAVMPSYAHEGDAGLDLHSNEDVLIKAHAYEMIHTGACIALPEGYEDRFDPRSGLAFKHGLTVLNAPGTVDSGYRGEMKVVLINHSDEDYQVKRGDKIAQLVIAKYETVSFEKTETLDETERGAGGYGSSGY